MGLGEASCLAAGESAAVGCLAVGELEAVGFRFTGALTVVEFVAFPVVAFPDWDVAVPVCAQPLSASGETARAVMVMYRIIILNIIVVVKTAAHQAKLLQCSEGPAGDKRIDSIEQVKRWTGCSRPRELENRLR